MTRSLFPAPDFSANAPLAERMRPAALEDVVGQSHLIASDGFLARAVSGGRVPSIILWGPPGTGKTTLARIVADASHAQMFALSAVTSGVKDVREVVARAEKLQLAGQSSILFIDEIHRFHRGQQDALLPHVEAGTITLIGATTENPAHSIVAPLVSRSRVLVLSELTSDDIARVLERALQEERGLAGRVTASSDVIAAIAEEADGDARRALTTLEIAAQSLADEQGELSVEDVKRAAQARLLRADRQGDAHYDLASAFIKSMRGSDPDAAVYYLMRMVESGEDPRFMARRMIIFAAEDIGLADPRALTVAVAAAQAFEQIGLPEGTLPLSEAALYLATAPKSNSVIAARNAARDALQQSGTLPIPMPIRDGSAPLSKSLGIGRGYRYPHAEVDHHTPVDYLPEALAGKRFYEPSDQGEENEIAERVRRWREAVDRRRGEE